MKISSVILLVTFALMFTALFATNILLKKEYDKIDKSDLYWTFGKILEQPFKYIFIEGGNNTNIAFEPSAKPSVRVFKNWYGYENKTVKAFVKNDTLFVKFPAESSNPSEKQFLQRTTMVRIFSPELVSVDGFNTNLGLFKMKQKNLKINIAGKSKLEVESYLNDFDNLQITQHDSSQVVFEMAPEIKGAPLPMPQRMIVSEKNLSAVPVFATSQHAPGWEMMFIKNVDANIQDNSLLDLGHAQVDNFHLNISDTAAVIISGQSLKNIKK